MIVLLRNFPDYEAGNLTGDYEMITLKEMIQENDRMIFIRPKHLRTIKIGLDRDAPGASVMVSLDGENFENEDVMMRSGESLEIATDVKIVAIKLEWLTTSNSGAIFWSF